jgi:glycosyltransferase involved in cell wall biosynthesis
MLTQITPLVLTFNEARNIERTLSGLHWASRIVVLDSFSTDETAVICGKHSQVDFIQRKFDNHTNQWNFGLAQARTEWVLALDADYFLPDAFVQELRDWTPADGVNAYFASFKYCVHGQPLRGSLYPPRPVLFRPERCRYVPDGHTQKLEIEGATSRLSQFIHHDDRKPLSQWVWAQDRYAALEAEKLLARSGEKLPLQDRIRRMALPAPGLVFFYTLFAKRLLLDGWRGWFYAYQRTLVELLISLRLLEGRWSGASSERKTNFK